MNGINKCAATEQEVAEYHGDGWVNKRAKIGQGACGKKSACESGEEVCEAGKKLYVHLCMCIYRFIFFFWQDGYEFHFV